MPSTPPILTWGKLKQIMAEGNYSDDLQLVVDSGWVKSVDPSGQVPWEPLYQATPSISPSQSFILFS